MRSGKLPFLVILMGLPLLVLGLFAASWTQDEGLSLDKTEPPEPSGEISVVTAGPVPPSLLKAVSMEEAAPLAPVYESLVRLDSRLVPRPSLATAWERSEDGLRWEFSLREGVMFHDGNPLSARQVVDSYLSYLKPPVSPAWALQLLPLAGVAQYLEDTFWEAHAISLAEEPDSEADRRLEEALELLLAEAPVEKVDEFTVRFNLQDPYPALPSLTAFLPIFGQAEDGAVPPGTGPFRLAGQEEDSVILEANLQHWEGPPFLKRLVISSVPHPRERVEAALSGRADLIQLPPAGQDALMDAGTHRLHCWTTGTITVAALNSARPHLSPAVREALDLAVDREDLSSRGFRGLAEPVPAAFDPYRAAEILEMDGWLLSSPGRRLREGKQLKMEITYLDREPLRQVTSHLAWSWEQMGVSTVPLPAENPAALWSRAVSGEFDVLLMELPAWPDPVLSSCAVALPGSPFNPGRFTSPEIEALCQKALAAPDSQVRTQIWERLAGELGAARPALKLYRSPVMLGSRDDLIGLKDHPMGLWGLFQEAPALSRDRP